MPQNVGFSHHTYWNNDVFTEIHNTDLELVFNKLMHSDVEKNKQTHNKKTTTTLSVHVNRVEIQRNPTRVAFVLSH